MVDFLDLPEMARLLGDEYVILLRGHSRTLRAGDNVRVPGVIDVTSYPHTGDIFLAADAMISTAENTTVRPAVITERRTAASVS